MWMITVVEQPMVVTRLVLRTEPPARAFHARLRELMQAERWLTVTMSTVQDRPWRSSTEMERVERLFSLALKKKE